MFWQGKSVFLTGHTGFKGGWLAFWLSSMGAQVHGYSLTPPTQPSFFDEIQLNQLVATHTIGDIRDLKLLTSTMQQAAPQIVFHMAAQPLVLRSYEDPVETYQSNVMGTVNLLEAVRGTPTVKSVVSVTTDKCYENREWVWPYRESEPLGGYDPYSSSKACAEIVTAAYRRSFLQHQGVQIATARAGNVIGGGDWAANRLVPDFLRSLEAGSPITIRSPAATRPWQHVLEPLAGYLRLAELLCTANSTTTTDVLASAWNFGPEESDSRPVQWIVERLCQQVAGSSWELQGTPTPHEAHCLKLDSSKAKHYLNWQPRWSLDQALRMTLDWHLAWKRGEDMRNITGQQILQYSASMP